MTIHELKIYGFGKHRDLEITFNDGTKNLLKDKKNLIIVVILQLISLITYYFKLLISSCKFAKNLPA